MKKELQILIIEDNDDDLFRIDRELKKGGLAFHATRVATKDDFVDQIQHHRPDVVLSDHGLPSFDGFTALDIVQKKCPDVPFIFVTGSYDYGMVAEMHESGAADYVYKNQLGDLVPAVKQALTEAEQRQKETESELELELPNRSQPLAQDQEEDNSLAICSVCKKVRTEKGKWEQIEHYFLTHSQATISLAICPDCARTTRDQ